MPIVRELITVLGFRVEENKIRRAEAAVSRYRQTAQRAARATRGLNTNLVGFGRGLVGLTTAAFTLRRVAGELTEFERLQGILVTLEGSVDRARRAFEFLDTFAQKVPFNIDQVTRAYLRLKNVGLEPTEMTMMGLSNVAAAMGTDIERLVDAATGIPAGLTRALENVLGGQVALNRSTGELEVTVRGMTHRMNRDINSVIGFLQQLGETDFAGGVEQQMGRLPGLSSLAVDSIKRFVRAMGEKGGLIQALRDFLQEISGVDESGESLAVLLGRTLSIALKQLTQLVRFLKDNIVLLKVGLVSLIAVGTGSAALRFGRWIIGIAGAMRTLGGLRGAGGAAAAISGAIGAGGGGGTSIIPVGGAGAAGRAAGAGAVPAAIVASAVLMIQDVLAGITGGVRGVLGQNIDASVSGGILTESIRQERGGAGRDLFAVTQQRSNEMRNLFGFNETEANIAAGASFVSDLGRFIPDLFATGIDSLLGTTFLQTSVDVASTAAETAIGGVVGGIVGLPRLLGDTVNRVAPPVDVTRFVPHHERMRLQRLREFQSQPSLVEGLFVPMLQGIQQQQVQEFATMRTNSAFSRARRGVGEGLAMAEQFGPVIRVEVTAEGIGQEEFVQATARAMASEVVNSMLSQLESLVSGVGGLVGGG